MKSTFYKGPQKGSPISPAVPVSHTALSRCVPPRRPKARPATIPGYVLYHWRSAPQFCVDPKLIDLGFLYGERDWSEEEEEEEQKPASSPSRKRKTLTRKKAQGADTQSPKKKARSTPAKPRASTSKAGSASPQKKGRK
ncbi:hypothetical protein ARMSODRAFT_1022825 [Armillaria solidipes]|uniref:Uncharacterized protein n=1 Tax=Armillaria solidipes TaxID=1076256 RepID=A0A2H3BP49_9AGAR|nr:hypothetical protein ARMSODRAFT_1022825 [Armillaria solidipes]